jgi:CheY-like chemotaxis protein
MPEHHVLVIEGDSKRRAAIARALHRYTVHQATDGAAALDYLGECYDAGAALPDVIVCAFDLPILSGPALAPTIHNLPQRIPIVFIARDATPTMIRQEVDAIVTELSSIVGDILEAIRSRVHVIREGRTLRVAMID